MLLGWMDGWMDVRYKPIYLCKCGFAMDTYCNTRTNRMAKLPMCTLRQLLTFNKRLHIYQHKDGL